MFGLFPTLDSDFRHRTLVYLYGDVPYVDKIQDQFRIDFTRTPKEEVIAHMVEDLQFAVENLPTDPDAVKVGKLTKWAAEHLLSEVYLMQGDYANAFHIAGCAILIVFNE